MYTVKFIRYDLDRPVGVKFSGSLPEVLRWCAGCAHTSGPSGPLYSFQLYRPDGTQVPSDSWEDEVRALGLVPYRTHGGEGRLVDARPT